MSHSCRPWQKKPPRSLTPCKVRKPPAQGGFLLFGIQSRKMREPYPQYLQQLGFDHSPTGLEGLRQLVRRHVIRVPFENISKLLLVGRERRGRPTTLTEFLDGLERYDLGGTCYTSNPFFVELLRQLGYDADLLGCDMRRANVHTAIRVRIAGTEYHVDVGYGGPFYEPLPLSELPHDIKQGGYRYVLDRGSDGRLALDVFNGEERVHGYRVNEMPRQFEFFRDIILNSFRPTATFMTQLRVVRYFDDHAVELRNSAVNCHFASESRKIAISSMKQLRETFVDRFRMPRCPVEKAVETLERITRQGFFTMGEGNPFS
jgi:N-hydroxyarylamine O-acetyltransferase